MSTRVPNRLLTSAAVVFGILLAIVGVSRLAPAGESARIYRVGWFSGTPVDPTQPEGCPAPGLGGRIWKDWIRGLQERGYVLGQNLLIQCRYTHGDAERAPAIAADLVGQKIDLVVASATPLVRAVKQATRGIPIVMWGVLEPVQRGLVTNLARPEGNVTGLAESADINFHGKYLQLLKDAVPRLSRVAVLGVPLPGGEPQWAQAVQEILRTAAGRLGLTLKEFPVPAPDQLPTTLAAIRTWGPEALLELPHPSFVPAAAQIVAFAAQQKLPGLYMDRRHVALGGLMTYASNNDEVGQRLSYYVDRLLQGTKPGDLPVEQPTRYTLIINLRAAQALGLTLPPAFLIQAEEVIR